MPKTPFTLSEGPAEQARGRRVVAIFAAALVAGALAWFGGPRLPDEEVMFETCEALHDRRSFAVENVSRYTGFGVAAGKDGGKYQVFGPGLPVACVPFMTAARLLDRTGWYLTDGKPTLNPTFYLGDGFERFVDARPPRDPALHAERAITSLVNVLLHAVGSVLFYLCAAALTRRRAPALAATLLYMFGTLAWPYAGTFLSEPLSSALLLSSLLLALYQRRASAGVAAGLAVAAHVTGFLALPFLALVSRSRALPSRRALLRFLVGFAIVAVVLAIHNQLRFGSPFETGRSLDPELARKFDYGHFTAPWRGLYGLVLGPGKGLLFTCPAILLGLFAWRSFHRQRATLSWLFAGLVVTRLLFVASRTDWHGGFALGPRLLVPVIPFLILPVACWLDSILDERRIRALIAFAAASALCVAEQVMFVIGEPFSMYHRFRIDSIVAKHDIFGANEIYLRWQYSPLLHILDGRRGPFLLRDVPISDVTLWALTTVVVVALSVLAVVTTLRKSVPP